MDSPNRYVLCLMIIKLPLSNPLGTVCKECNKTSLPNVVASPADPMLCPALVVLAVAVMLWSPPKESPVEYFVQLPTPIKHTSRMARSAGSPFETSFPLANMLNRASGC